MDVEYTWILKHWKNCCQFGLQLSLVALIVQTIYLVGGEGMAEIIILAQ